MPNGNSVRAKKTKNNSKHKEINKETKKPQENRIKKQNNKTTTTNAHTYAKSQVS